MTNPLVSVIIATHNRENLLPEAVESILNQTFQDFEIIIVDDCSSDDTPEVVHQLEKKDPRIRSIRSEQNIGPGAARNLGVSQASGDFIAILDDDDISSPIRLHRQSAILLEQPDVDLVFSSIRIVNQKNQEVGRYPGIVIRDEFPKEPCEVFKLTFLEETKIINTTLMFRRKLFQIYGGYPDTPWICEDWYLMMKFSALGVKMTAIKDPLVDVFRAPDHNTLTKNRKKLIDAQRQVIRMTKEFLWSKHLPLPKSLYRTALANQRVREARLFSGLHGVFLCLQALTIDPHNVYAHKTLRMLSKRAISKISRKL